MTKTVKKSDDAARQIAAAYDLLVGMASNGESLNNILEAAAALAGQSVAYLNSDGDVISISPASPSQSSFHEKVRFYPLLELQRFFDVVAVREADERIGHIILQKGIKGLEEVVPAIRLAIQVYLNARSDTQNKIRKFAEKFLQKLPDSIRADELEEHFKAMCVDFSAGIQVVAATADEINFLRRLNSRLHNFSRNQISIVKKRRLLSVLSPPSSSDLASLTRNLAEICSHVASKHYSGEPPSDVRIAFGGARRDRMEIVECTREALRTLHILKTEVTSDFIKAWDDLGSLRLICKIASDESAIRFCKDTLKTVGFSEFSEKDELLDTLVMLEKNNWNLREVARKMFYHHNTIKHRYEKIQEIIGENLSDPGTRFNISLAIRILKCTPPGEDC